MTKQEEIREGMKPYLRAVAPFVCPECKHPLGKDILDEQAVAHIMEYLHSQGVVIKGDRVLPYQCICEDGCVNDAHSNECYDFNTYHKAGLEAVEPLIKEVDNEHTQSY